MKMESLQQQQGVPQGSVLSVTLFAIAIDNIGFIGYCTPNQSIYAYFYLISYTYFIFIFVFGVANIIYLLVNFLNTLIAI